MANTAKKQLPYIDVGQGQKEITHNDALSLLDMLCQAVVLDRDLNTPPSSPAIGDCYIIGPSPIGLWTGSAYKLAAWYNGWQIRTPQEGWLVYVQDEDCLVAFNGTNWSGLRLAALMGTAGAPSFAFDGDANTGFFSPAADNAACTTAGTERWRVTSSGNMGIGTTGPSTRLHVNGPVRVGSYTVAGVPSASTTGAGALIYVSNESGGACLAFSDGTVWRRVRDNATIS